uniref:Uncharacterized protein n=1 Tax=viral metagenome TaxID=1070528 RepID=A0A6C0ERY7_9ZZZZ
MTTNSSITKQMYINRLPIPQDLQLIIKNYCFYDFQTWETIKFIKLKKNRIHHLLNNKTNSRAYLEEFLDDGTEIDEHWVFSVFESDDENNPEFQLQAVNCSLCGEYKETRSVFLPEQIKCKCPPIEYNDNDYDEYSYHPSDDDSFDD